MSIGDRFINEHISKETNGEEADIKWGRGRQGSEHGKILGLYSKYRKLMDRFEQGNDII